MPVKGVAMEQLKLEWKQYTVRYLYRPAKRTDVDERVLQLKALIRKSLEANVKQETREYEGL